MEEVKKQFEEKVIEIARVSRTVKGGKRIGFRALIVIGDKAGKVGIGLGKSTEVAGAIRKAANQAKKNIVNIKITDRGTIGREILSDLGATKVLLRPAPEGTSIIAGGVVRAVCELSGIRNLVAKSLGSNNKINAAKATIKGLIEASDV
jgi:small subunit ribosomal protein S5